MMMRLLFAACLAAVALGHGTTRTTISMPLTVDGGEIRKCTASFGNFGGREDSLSLYGNKGEWSYNDTSDTSGGFCTFHSSVDKGTVESYSVSVDMYHVAGSNALARGGIAFNVVDKCNFDFAYFRPQEVPTCLQLGAVRGCHWAQINPWWSLPCPDGAASRDQWYGAKVDVSPDTITVSKKEPGAAWVEAVSVPTSNLFGNHLVAHAGLLVLNGRADMCYFNGFELEYSPLFETNSFSLELEGTAAVSTLPNAKRTAVTLFRGISSGLSVDFAAERSDPTILKSLLTTVPLPLTVAGGTVRKCDVAYGAYGGREDSMSLYANRGSWSHDDTSDSLNGWCAFHSNENRGEYRPYSVEVDLYQVKAGNAHSHGGMAFNVFDKCTFDYVYFAPHNPAACFIVGSMRGCKLVSDTHGACPDGNPSWNAWYSIKVDVTDSAVVLWKRQLGAAWVQSASVPTSNVFGNHPVARAGLLVANGYQDKTYFNRFQLEYTATLPVAEDAFTLKLAGAAAVNELESAKRAAVEMFRNISSDLNMHFVAEPSKSRRLLFV